MVSERRSLILAATAALAVPALVRGASAQQQQPAAPAGAPAAPVLQGLRERLSDDLDSPGAIALVDAWAARTLAATADDEQEDGAPMIVADAVDALLGVALDPGALR